MCHGKTLTFRTARAFCEHGAIYGATCPSLFFRLRLRRRCRLRLRLRLRRWLSRLGRSWLGRPRMVGFQLVLSISLWSLWSLRILSPLVSSLSVWSSWILSPVALSFSLLRLSAILRLLFICSTSRGTGERRSRPVTRLGRLMPKCPARCTGLIYTAQRSLSLSKGPLRGVYISLWKRHRHFFLFLTQGQIRPQQHRNPQGRDPDSLGPRHAQAGAVGVVDITADAFVRGAAVAFQ